MVMRAQGRSCARSCKTTASCKAVIESRNTTADSQTDLTHSAESPQVARFVDRNRIFCC